METIYGPAGTQETHKFFGVTDNLTEGVHLNTHPLRYWTSVRLTVHPDALSAAARAFLYLLPEALRTVTANHETVDVLCATREDMPLTPVLSTITQVERLVKFNRMTHEEAARGVAAFGDDSTTYFYCPAGWVKNIAMWNFGATHARDARPGYERAYLRDYTSANDALEALAAMFFAWCHDGNWTPDGPAAVHVRPYKPAQTKQLKRSFNRDVVLSAMGRLMQQANGREKPTVRAVREMLSRGGYPDPDSWDEQQTEAAWTALQEVTS